MLPLIARHNCNRRHRTYRTLAKCKWPRAEWIAGQGEYATLAWCSVLTIVLHSEYDSAVEAEAAIDYTGCGGKCTGRHETIRLAL